MKKLLLLLIPIILILVGCSLFKSAKLFIFGGVYLEKIYNQADSLLYTYGGKYGDFSSDPILDTATAKINDVVIQTRSYMDGSGYFTDTIKPIAETEYKLILDTDVGDANATCKLPGDFMVKAPDSVGKNAEVKIAWGKSKEANWYLVEIECESIPYGTYYDTTKVVTDTFYTIAANTISKAGYVYVYIAAGNGPKFEAGSKGNMKGDGKGFWMGMQERIDYIRVDTPYDKENKISHRDPKQVLRNYLEAIAPESEDARELLREMK